ncbi:MAG TPA: M14 family metallopeptidase [Longimicrobiales bacterium]|nr:M14 family metallopeptidase [Longimicrobiales bacterium]
MRESMKRGARIAAVAAALAVGMMVDATTSHAQMFAHPDRDPRVNLRFDRYYDYAAITDAITRLQRAYPKFLTVQSLGRSGEGRDIPIVIINNPDTGPHTQKTAFWADANIHGNEIQGTEVNLYLIWFLMENYDALPKVKELVDQRAFYIVPTMNPDGRENFLKTGGPSRSGMMAWDSDQDGRTNEDNPDDLDGDGEIRQMRKHVPGQGTHVQSPIDPRLMVIAPAGTKGDYVLLGSEGVDTDGDGRRGEDARGGYDMNRDFPSDWQPPHIQGGANRYPFSWPESRAVGQWLKDHPNIAGAQSWHNSGGMILRGPGSQHYKGTGDYTRRDNAAYDYLGERGELMLPYYRYMTVWKDLYTVYGGTLDWAHDALGIMSFTNELWSNNQFYGPAWTDSAAVPREMQQLFFNDRLGMGAWYKAWTPVRHPELGDVEVGGWSKWYGRTTPPFMLQELAHRNAMFALFHADEMPLLEWGDVHVERIAGSTYRVRAEMKNTRAIPTRIEAAELYRSGRPDYFTISGARVQAGGFTSGELGDRLRLQEQNPERIEVTSGIPGRSRVSVTWIVTGSGNVDLAYTSLKGGTMRRTVALR